MSQGSGDTTARELDLDSDPGEVSRPASAAKVAAPSSEGETQSREERGIALVVDAEVTSCLMMGALSPGLKRHSVTLFEGEYRRFPAACFPHPFCFPPFLDFQNLWHGSRAGPNPRRGPGRGSVRAAASSGLGWKRGASAVGSVFVHTTI